MRGDAPHLHPYRRRRTSARGRRWWSPGLPNITPIFSRIWLMKIRQVLVRETTPVSLRSAWDISRACRPTWLSPISPSSSAFGTSAATESTTSDVDRAGGDQGAGDLQRLLAVVGLRNQQVVHVDAQLPGVQRIQRVLGVDERGGPARRLCLAPPPATRWSSCPTIPDRRLRSPFRAGILPRRAPGRARSTRSRWSSPAGRSSTPAAVSSPFQTVSPSGRWRPGWLSCDRCSPCGSGKQVRNRPDSSQEKAHLLLLSSISAPSPASGVKPAAGREARPVAGFVR